MKKDYFFFTLDENANFDTIMPGDAMTEAEAVKTAVEMVWAKGYDAVNIKLPDVRERINVNKALDGAVTVKWLDKGKK